MRAGAPVSGAGQGVSLDTTRLEAWDTVLTGVRSGVMDWIFKEMISELYGPLLDQVAVPVIRQMKREAQRWNAKR